MTYYFSKNCKSIKFKAGNFGKQDVSMFLLVSIFAFLEDSSMIRQIDII